MMSSNSDDAVYGIAAVARLTGIPLNTLRAWERRYALVVPERGDGNQRQYARSDVVRLQMVKQLVDRGHAISTLAGLDEAELRQRLQLHRDAPVAVQVEASASRVLIYGDALPYLIDAWRGDLAPLEILGVFGSYAEFEARACLERPDVLVLEWPALDPDVPSRLRALQVRSGAARVVVVYGFAPAQLIARLQQDGIVAVRAPVTAAALREACRRDVAPAGAAQAAVMAAAAAAFEVTVPPRRFDSKTLAAVANLPTGIRCECPHHLADLLFRITAFETYSAECESRNERDAALHSHLHQVAGQARALLEDALDYLLMCEGIDLGVYSSS
jgi:DNA-binding transcriptional MerR regulator